MPGPSCFLGNCGSAAGIAAAAKTLRTGTPFHIGRNLWYLAPNGPLSTIVLKVRQGIIGEIGIGAKTVTQGHKVQLAFLKSFT